MQTSSVTWYPLNPLLCFSIWFYVNFYMFCNISIHPCIVWHSMVTCEIQALCTMVLCALLGCFVTWYRVNAMHIVAYSSSKLFFNWWWSVGPMWTPVHCIQYYSVMWTSNAFCITVFCEHPLCSEVSYHVNCYCIVRYGVAWYQLLLQVFFCNECT